MTKAGTLITLGLSFAVVVGACGGKVVFVAQGAGGAGGAASTTVGTTATFSTTEAEAVGTCTGGCNDAATATVTGAGGGPNSCTTCAEALTGIDPPTCPAALPFYNALLSCVCDASMCGGPTGKCKAACPSSDPNCEDCEQMSVNGPCMMQADACAAN